MQAFDSNLELDNGRKYDTSNTSMSENSSSKDVPATNFTGTNENEGLEIRILTQAEVDELIKSFIATPHKVARGFGSACPRKLNCIASELLHKCKYLRYLLRTRISAR